MVPGQRGTEETKMKVRVTGRGFCDVRNVSEEQVIGWAADVLADANPNEPWDRIKEALTLSEALEILADDDVTVEEIA